MSIYVAVSCIGIDPELIKTIESCINNAANKEDIFIGVALIGEFSLYEDFKEYFKNNNNVKVLYRDYVDHLANDNVGVGIGRHLAMKYYDDQDYILQIDSHSRMLQDWDIYLIEKFKLAQIVVNNEKVILTATPGRYTYSKTKNGAKWDIQELYTEQYMGVNIWREKEFYRYEKLIPSWGHVTPYGLQITEELIKINGLLPASKICAAFVFGNRHFANNTHLDKNILFWEEEIFQSIELLSDGFTLVYPGPNAVISHLYTDDIIQNIGRRTNIHDAWRVCGKKIESQEMLIVENYLNFFRDENNQNKIKFFETYNSFSFSKIIHTINTYPTQYANIGFLPL